MNLAAPAHQGQKRDRSAGFFRQVAPSASGRLDSGRWREGSGRTQSYWPFLACALLLEACLLSLHGFDAPRVPVIPFVLILLGAFAAYAVALFLLFRKASSPAALPMPLVLGCALLFRITVLPIPSIWDDDLYRYRWDGRVGLHGVNPYLYAPEAPELEALQDDDYDLVSFKAVRTVYPPLLQFLFQGSQWAAPSSLIFLKSLALVFELALMAVLLSLLRELGYPSSWILIYAWNPLPVKEFANSGHLDSLVLFLLFLALRYLLKGRALAAHLVLGLSVLAKLFSGLALPFFLFYVSRRGRKLLFSSLATFLAVVWLGYAPFLEAHFRLFEGLSIYSRYWTFNAGPYALMAGALRATGWDQWWMVRALALVCLGVVLIRQLFTCRPGNLSLLKAVFSSLATLVILSPAVQPWYVCWLVPFLVFFPSPPWVAFSGLAVLSYLFYLNFAEMAWPRAIEFGLPAILAVWTWTRNETASGRHSNLEIQLKEAP
ncbi:MAG: glycosyltransferase 87 family protein [Acidobacteriota bacterium]